MLDVVALDSALPVETDTPVAAEIVPLAGQDEIVVAVEAELAWPAGHAGGQSRGHGPLGRLAFLAAEAAAHAPRLAGNVGIRQVENPGHHVLDLGRVLGRG